MWDAINTWEVNSVIWIQRNLSSSFLDGFWTFITRFAEHWAIIPIMLLIFAIIGLRHSLKFGFVIGSAGFFSWLIKLATNRPRPHLASEEVELLYPPISSSFTSGHTAIGCAIAICLCVFIWKFKTNKFFRIVLCASAVSLFGLGVGFSRIYLGVHYPSDVIASFITAVPFYFLSVWLFEKIAGLKLFATLQLPSKIKHGLFRRVANDHNEIT